MHRTPNTKLSFSMGLNSSTKIGAIVCASLNSLSVISSFSYFTPSKTVIPVISAGSKSEVNWIRLNLAFNEMEIAFASVVSPVPCTSFKRICPSSKRATITLFIALSLPIMTFLGYCLTFWSYHAPICSNCNCIINRQRKL